MVLYDAMFAIVTTVIGLTTSFFINGFINIPFLFLQQALGL